MRDQVERSNRARLDALPGELYTFTAIDDGIEPPEQRAKTLENVMAVKTLTLKVDAQVMSIKNYESSTGIVNGTIGKIIGFRGADEVPEDEEEFADEAEFNLKVRSMKAERRERSTEPRDFEAKMNKRDPDLEAKISKMSKPRDLERVPVVQWTLAGGATVIMRLERHDFKVEEVGDKIKARRSQVRATIAPRR